MPPNWRIRATPTDSGFEVTIQEVTDDGDPVGDPEVREVDDLSEVTGSIDKVKKAGRKKR